MTTYKRVPKFFINQDGEVFSKKTGKRIKTCINKYGYERITTIIGSRTDNTRKSLNLKVHRMVAETFIKNPNNLQTVNHKDGNKLNNTVSNLEWMSSSDNLRHAHRNGLIKYSSKSIPVIGISKAKSVFFNGMTEAANELKLNKTSIWASIVGKRPTAGGFTWHYASIGQKSYLHQ